MSNIIVLLKSVVILIVDLQSQSRIVNFLVSVTLKLGLLPPYSHVMGKVFSSQSYKLLKIKNTKTKYDAYLIIFSSLYKKLF